MRIYLTDAIEVASMGLCLLHANLRIGEGTATTDQHSALSRIDIAVQICLMAGDGALIGAKLGNSGEGDTFQFRSCPRNCERTRRLIGLRRIAEDEMGRDREPGTDRRITWLKRLPVGRPKDPYATEIKIKASARGSGIGCVLATSFSHSASMKNAAQRMGRAPSRPYR